MITISRLFNSIWPGKRNPKTPKALTTQDILNGITSGDSYKIWSSAKKLIDTGIGKPLDITQKKIDLVKALESVAADR